MPTHVPSPVEPVQVDVAQQRGDHPALRGAGHRLAYRTALHHSCPQHHAQQLQDSLVADPFLHRLHQLLVRNRLEAVGDVRLDHPPATPPGLIDEHLQGVVRRPPGPEPETNRAACRPRRPARARSSTPACTTRSRTVGIDSGRCSAEPGLGINTRRAGSGRYLPSLSSAATSSSSRATPYSSTSARVVLSMPGCAVVPAHRDPRPPQDVPAVDLVSQRVEPSPGIGLGRPVQRMLQGTDRIRDSNVSSTAGLATRALTEPLPTDATHRRSSGPSLTDGCVVRPAQPVLRPPPTPTRHATHFPGSPVIGHVAPATPHRRSPGRGGPPQFPPPPSERSAPHTPGSPSRLRLQALHRFHGLHPDFGGSALPAPTPKNGPLTTPQASRHATDRSVAPPQGLSTLGFDAGRFPPTPPACYRASWQLPGPDSHRQATTSLSNSRSPIHDDLLSAGRTKRRGYASRWTGDSYGRTPQGVDHRHRGAGRFVSGRAVAGQGLRGARDHPAGPRRSTRPASTTSTSTRPERMRGCFCTMGN